MEVGPREAIDDPACEQGSAAQRENIQTDIQHRCCGGASPLIDHILHHSKRGSEGGVLKETCNREQACRRPPVCLQNSEQIQWYGDDAADRRNQCVPPRLALG